MIFAFSAFLFFLAIGTPIVFVLGIAATLTLLLIQPEIPLTIVSQRMYDSLNSFVIMAIPFFIFAGAIMDAGGISRRIVDFASALVGWIVGSLLMVSVVAATGLAAISGSGSADVAAISAIMQPELRRRKYDIDFSAAVIACAGSLAQIIPPSLMMVVVALVSNLSVGAMFLAGVVPGLLTVPGLVATAYIHARRGGPQYRETEPFTLARLMRTMWAAVPGVGHAGDHHWRHHRRRLHADRGRRGGRGLWTARRAVRLPRPQVPGHPGPHPAGGGPDGGRHGHPRHGKHLRLAGGHRQRAGALGRLDQNPFPSSPGRSSCWSTCCSC